MAEAIAERFLSARKAALGLADYPGTAPTTLTEAYAIQAAALARMEDRVAGWKVGRILPPLSDQYGSDRLAGPIFASTVVTIAPDARGFVFADGFGAIEAEFLFRIGKVPPAGQRAFTLEEAADHVDAVHIGVEIASSPFIGINTMGPAVTVSDFGNNNGLLIGPAIPDWRNGAYAEQQVTTRIDGAQIGAGAASAFSHGAIGSVRFLLENLVAREIAIQPGWWISTGAVTGVHAVRPGQEVEMDFGSLGTLHCRIDTQEPR
ncbi:fumarylacetoacetate hydrolase family protein [Sphingobium sp. BYY-5]|uniref:2-keto-4-pentenoate hydratase n=1 Tax=Sphingobium sp. BYY-5 TaxID=2926400 RepID=UPI001FA76D94|nr:fumarylacetoacetate hydrolase family protein [Sphingobium sp. BYY-5]MCI4591843.1 fumarylacetoacetate hydrolase family protein [Sphingobium sp. BYY-5]